MPLDAFARPAIRDIDSETLKLFAAVRPRNFQGKLIAAAEIGRRPIKRDERWRFSGEALLYICGFERTAFDSHGAMRGRHRKLDGWQRTGRAVRPYIGVNADPKIASSRRFEFPLGNVSLRLCERGRQAAKDRDRQRDPACQIASVVLPAHDRHPRVLRQNGENGGRLVQPDDALCEL